MAYAARFTLGSDERKKRVSTRTVKNEKKPEATALPAPEDAAEHRTHEVAVGEPLLELDLKLVDDMVVTVKVLDEPVVDQTLEVPGRVLGEHAALLDHRRHHEESKGYEQGDQTGEDGRNGQRSTIPRLHNASTRGLSDRVMKKATTSRVSTCVS